MVSEVSTEARFKIRSYSTADFLLFMLAEKNSKDRWSPHEFISEKKIEKRRNKDQRCTMFLLKKFKRKFFCSKS